MANTLQSCGDIMTKKKLDPHKNRCHGSSFTCIDCMTHFPGFDYRSHTSCISEAQKYQGRLYKEKPVKGKGAKSAPTAAEPVAVVETAAPVEPVVQVEPVVVADTVESVATKDDKSKKSKKRKREDVASGPDTIVVEQSTEDVKPSKKSKKSKKDRAVDVAIVAPISAAELSNGLMNGHEGIKELTEVVEVITDKANPKPSTMATRDPLLESFTAIATKELGSKDEIDMAKVIKKWKRKNGEDELEKLWKVLKLRKGEAGGHLVIA